MNSRSLLYGGSAALLAGVAGCSSSPPKPTSSTPVTINSRTVNLPTTTIQGKWVSDQMKAGKVITHGVLEFMPDGKYAGEVTSLQFKRTDAGTYQLDGTTLTRKETSQKMVKDGKEEKMNPINVTVHIGWHSPDEFVIAGAEDAPWKRAK